VSFKGNSKIALISQAPGLKAHNSGIPFDDPSGRRLRDWLGVNEKIFYAPSNFAILPMAFCYPGKGESGDLPPLKECRKIWDASLAKILKEPKLYLLIGKYAQDHILKNESKTLTENVKNWQQHLKNNYLPVPHPSPRNNIWLKKNPWFEKDVVPNLKKQVKSILKN
jgi:uracil-DNA glycosylase family 4